MRYFKTISNLALAAGMLLAGASALPAQDRWANDRYRDMRGDRIQADRLRERIAYDRARIDEDYRCSRRYQLERDYAELRRDERALGAVSRDLRYDRGRW